MTSLPDRIRHLADSTEAVVRGWTGRRRQPRDTGWRATVTVGRWTLATSSVMEEEDGGLTVTTFGMSVPLEGDVLEETSRGRTSPGAMSLDALEATNLLRACAGQSLDALASVLEWTCKDCLANGLPADRVAGARSRAVVKDVMES